MKKILALVLALSLMAAMVFAEPVVLASGIIQTTDLISEADLADPLFADIAAPQLTAVEAEQVEGDGWRLGVALGLAGGTLIGSIGAVYGFVSNFRYGPTATFSAVKTYALYGFGIGAGLGFLIGSAF
ncbi:MAG: hypothetical protein LBG14_01930 [Treponema sp.]|nr:hypothetical protein [Treponema sp.]